MFDSETSLRQRLAKRLTFQIVAILGVGLAVGAAFLLAYSLRQHSRQTDLWAESLPKSLLPHLIESDNFSVSSKVRLVSSTGLFRVVSVRNRQGLLIASVPASRAPDQHWVPIGDEAGVVWGYFSLDPDLWTVVRSFILAMAGVGLFLAAIAGLLRRWISAGLNAEVAELSFFISKINQLSSELSCLPVEVGTVQGSGTEVPTVPHFRVSNHVTAEQRMIGEATERLLGEIRRRQKEIVRYTQQFEAEKFSRELARTAAHVAHDIRSPLAALAAAEPYLALLPEDPRVLIRGAIGRIQDIANHLLERERGLGAKAMPVCDGSPQFLQSLVDSILSEKRMQFRSRLGITISFEDSREGYGGFANLQSREFLRLMSNLIDNAVESIAEIGRVEIRIRTEAEFLTVEVRDDGCGMSPAVMAIVGRRGETFGKEGGSGLGLFHARAACEGWGGTLSIESEVGRGTAVILRLPRAETPIWFAERLDIVSGTELVVVDDDHSIHQMWAGRGDTLRFKENGIVIVRRTCPSEVRKFSAQTKQRSLFLIDYEFLDAEETGIDLIRGLGIAKNSVLVTSHFEDERVRDECRALGIRLIPKGMAGFVPVRIH